MRHSSTLGFLALIACSSPARASPYAAGELTPDTPADAAAPSQALRVDRARPAVRLLVSLVLRAPFDRGYGVAFAYVPTRALEVGGVLALREERALEFGGSVAVHPFPGRFRGLIGRSTLSAVMPSSGGQAPTSARVDSGIGYGTLAQGVYLELIAGASYRLGPTHDHARWGLIVAARVGFGF